VRPSQVGVGWREVAEWKETRLTNQWQTIDVDLTPYVRAPGQYEVEFRKTGGRAAFEVRKAVAVMAGTEAPRLITKLARLHAWNLNRTAQVTAGAKGQTGLRVVARTKGTDPWRGMLYIRGVD